MSRSHKTLPQKPKKSIDFDLPVILCKSYLYFVS